MSEQLAEISISKELREYRWNSIIQQVVGTITYNILVVVQIMDIIRAILRQENCLMLNNHNLK